MALLTVKEFAARAGVPYRVVAQGVRMGRIRARLWGMQWAIEEEELMSPLWVGRRGARPTKEERAEMDAILAERRK